MHIHIHEYVYECPNMFTIATRKKCGLPPYRKSLESIARLSSEQAQRIYTIRIQEKKRAERKAKKEPAVEVQQEPAVAFKQEPPVEADVKVEQADLSQLAADQDMMREEMEKAVAAVKQESAVEVKQEPAVEEEEPAVEEDEPTSPAATFCAKYPSETYVHASRQRSRMIVLQRQRA